MQGLLHVVIGDEDADAAQAQLFDDALNVLHRDGVDPGKRFVEQDELWVRCQCPRNFRPPAFAAAQHVAVGLADLLQTEFADQLLEPVFLLGFGQRLQFEDGHDVVLHRELSKNRGFLRQVSDSHSPALVHGQVCDLLAVDEDPTRIRLHQADDGVKAGCLARTVWSEQAHHFTGVDLKGHTVDHPAFAVLLHQSFCAQGGWGVDCFHGSKIRTLLCQMPTENPSRIPRLAGSAKGRSVRHTPSTRKTPKMFSKPTLHSE